MKRVSLRNRLLLAGGLGLLLVTALASALLGHLFERAARDSLDAALEQDLLTVLAQAEVDTDGRVVLRQEPNEARFQRVFSGAYWQLAHADGTPLLQSRSLWDQNLKVPAASSSGSHFDLQGPLQQPLRVLAREVRLPRAQTPLQLVVALDRSELQAQVAQFRQRSALALALLVAAWLAVLATQIHFGLRPLRRLGRQVEDIRRGEAQRVDTQGLSAEIAPLADELNALLDHHQRMVSRARTSAQDLAHALKTPLSILAAEASQSNHTEDGWQQTVRAQGTRMQGSIDRYLAAGLAVDHRQRADVAPVVQALCGLLGRVHAARGVSFTGNTIDPTLQFSGAAADLEEMLGNLMDNAGKWATHTVQVTARNEAGRLCIEVSDDGPGLQESQLQSVLQRGVRLDQREGSSGLGLAIVADIAASHGGELSLHNAHPGLRATLWLPAG